MKHAKQYSVTYCNTRGQKVTEQVGARNPHLAKRRFWHRRNIHEILSVTRLFLSEERPEK